MRTLEQIKDICSRDNNIGMSEEEYRIFDKYTDMLWDAWQNWDDEDTKEFWEGEKKPAEPTDSFRDDFFNNFCFEDEFEYLEQITRKVEDGTEWLHSSEIIDNPETLVWALKEIEAEYIENESGIYTTLENLRNAEKYCIKYYEQD